jgi:hypothetical protein
MAFVVTGSATIAECVARRAGGFARAAIDVADIGGDVRHAFGSLMNIGGDPGWRRLVGRWGP